MRFRSGWMNCFLVTLLMFLPIFDSLPQASGSSRLAVSQAIFGSAVLLPAGKALLADAVAAEQNATSGMLGNISSSPFPPGFLTMRKTTSFPLPMCTFAGGLCGAINWDGTIAVPPAFDWVDNFHEGRALMRSGGLYGYVDASGRVVAKPQYRIAEPFSRGLAQVDVEGRSGLIDLEGREVLPPRYGFIVPFTPDIFWVSEDRTTSDGPPGTEQYRDIDISILAVGIGPGTRYIFPRGKWGLVDRSGAWIRQPEFSGIRFFDRSDFTLMWAKTEAGWGLIAPDGTWRVEPKFADARSLSDGLAAIALGGLYGFVDETGRIAIEPKFKGPSSFSGAFAPVRVGKQFGLIDRSGAWVVEPAFDMIYSGGFVIPKSWWSVKVGGKFGILDESARVVLSPRFDQTPRRCDDGRIIGIIDRKPHLFDGDGRPIEPAEGELWWPTVCDNAHVVKIGDKFTYADRELHLITPAKFEQAGLFVNGYAAAKFDGKFGLLRLDSTWVVEPSLEAVVPLSNGAALAEADGKFGMIDPSRGTWLVPPRLDGICSIQHGFVLGVTGKARGLLDKTGSWLIQPNFARVGLRISDGLIPAQIGDRWTFIDAAGAVAIDAKYDAPTFFQRGINWVKEEKAWCPIDRRGRRIPALQCEDSDPLRRQFSTRDCRIGP